MITISWTPADDNGTPIIRYDIFDVTDPETSYQYVGTTELWYFTFDGLSIGNIYKFKVQAISYAGSGPLSLESDFIIAATVPLPPQNLLILFKDS